MGKRSQKEKTAEASKVLAGESSTSSDVEKQNLFRQFLLSGKQLPRGEKKRSNRVKLIQQLWDCKPRLLRDIPRIQGDHIASLLGDSAEEAADYVKPEKVKDMIKSNERWRKISLRIGMLLAIAKE